MNMRICSIQFTEDSRLQRRQPSRFLSFPSAVGIGLNVWCPFVNLSLEYLMMEATSNNGQRSTYISWNKESNKSIFELWCYTFHLSTKVGSHCWAPPESLNRYFSSNFGIIIIDGHKYFNQNWKLKRTWVRPASIGFIELNSMAN